MRSDVFKEVSTQRNQVLWQILAFQSGFMNAGGFLACFQFVSHVTGYGTSVGLAIGRLGLREDIELALAPFFFLGGAMFAGWLVDRRLIRGEEPKVETGIVVIAALNVAVFLGGISGLFGVFGEPIEMRHDFFLLFFLCFACGLQNGLFTGLTDGKVRTTHLTGPTTDIGINWAKIVTLGRDDPERSRLVLLNVLRIKIVTAFSGGSLIAAMTFPKVAYEGFAIPAATSLFLVWYVRRLLKGGGGGGPVEEVPSLLVPFPPPGDEPRKAAGAD